MRGYWVTGSKCIANVIVPSVYVDNCSSGMGRSVIDTNIGQNLVRFWVSIVWVLTLLELIQQDMFWYF